MADWINGLQNEPPYVGERYGLVNSARGRLQISEIPNLIGRIIYQYVKMYFNFAVLEVCVAPIKLYERINSRFFLLFLLPVKFKRAEVNLRFFSLNEAHVCL